MKSEHMHWIQTAVTAVIAWAASKLGFLFEPIGVLLLMMVIDYITGMLASKAEAIQYPDDPAYGWSSRVGILGILKKLGYMGIIAAAVTFDYIIVSGASQLGIETPTKVFCGLAVTIWLILNELLSIVENCGRMGSPVPEWLMKNIAILKKKVDEKAEPEEDDDE